MEINRIKGERMHLLGIWDDWVDGYGWWIDCKIEANGHSIENCVCRDFWPLWMPFLNSME